MEKIWQIATHTPIWVYMILICLMFIGIKASKTRVTKVYSIFIMPMILFLVSVHTLLTTVTDINYATIGSWSVGMVIGAIIGRWQVKRLNVEIDRKNFLIHIPGSWSTMWIIFTIFVIKYYFGYQKASNAILVKQLWFQVSLLGVSGLCTGLFIGKLFGYLSQFKKGKDIKDFMAKNS